MAKEQKKLSQHDIELLKEINKIDKAWGWSVWPQIAHLAEQLEDEEMRKMWMRICANYNHREEASIGEL